MLINVQVQLWVCVVWGDKCSTVLCWHWQKWRRKGEEEAMQSVVCFYKGGQGRHPSWCAAEGWRLGNARHMTLACVMAAVREGTLRWWALLGRTGISVSTRFGTRKAGRARGSVQAHWCYVVILHHLKDHPLQPVAECWSEGIGVISRWWPMKHHWFLHRVSQ